MEKELVNIDFDKLDISFGKYVRDIAKEKNTSIVYQIGNELIEENPKTNEKKVLKKYDFQN